MKLTRLQLLIVTFIILLAPYVIYRLIWLRNSQITKGVVLYTNETRALSFTQTYPVIRFETEKYVIKVTGHYNAKYDEGDSIDIRYNPSHPLSYKINTFWNCWYDVFIWGGVLLLFGSFLLVRSIIPNKTFLITRRGIRQV